MKIRLHERKIVAKNVTKKFSGRPLLPLTLLPTGFFDNGTTLGGGQYCPPSFVPIRWPKWSQPHSFLFPFCNNLFVKIFFSGAPWVVLVKTSYHHEKVNTKIKLWSLK